MEGMDIIMRTDIIEFLEKEILLRCKSENNAFGFDIYYHIRAVVKNASQMAETYGADREIVIISAWLHDIASITEYSLYEDHHIHGQYIAEKILRKFSYDPKKIECVKKCIYHHRGSKLLEKQSPEEKCLADADASSHFDNFPSLLYMVYATKKMDLQEGLNFVQKKMVRSWNKLSEIGKTINSKKYKETMNVIERCNLLMNDSNEYEQ